MIHIGSLKSLYESHKAAIHELVYNDRPKNPILAKTKFVHMDKQGRKYNHFEVDTDLPLERYGKVLEYMQYIAKGLTAQEDEKIDNEIEEALEDGLRDQGKKSAVRIGALINERKRRRMLCIHTELIYNYLAVQWIREDENPSVFDNEIQLQKVEMLKEENQDNEVGFFFQQPELKKLRDLLNMSKPDWEKYMNEYQVQTARLKELLRQTASRKLSKEENKILGK